ncbi:YciI family protein [Nocardioides sp. AN3]
MSTYAVLLPGDESTWESATPEQRAAMYETHGRFAALLEERGHKIAGGAELTHSRTTKQVRRDAGGNVVVSDGPFAETVEQLTGFYLVESDDLDDLLQICGLLATGGAPVEVRATVDHGGE